MKVLSQMNFQHPAIPLAGVSVGGGVTSFVVTTLPYVQYCSALVGLICGILAIRAALKK